MRRPAGPATIATASEQEEAMSENGSGNGRVVINLATGLEDPERVTVAFLVAGAAAADGKETTIFLTKEAVRLATPGIAEGVACEGCPPLSKLAAQFADAGGRLLVCPICFSALKLS